MKIGEWRAYLAYPAALCRLQIDTIKFLAVNIRRQETVMSIILIPIGEVNPADLEELKTPLEAAFSRNVAIGREIPLPVAAWSAGRSQYDAGMMLEFLSLCGETSGGTRVLGVTNADLSLPGVNFVFGLAGRRSAVISFHRLRQSYYGLPEDTEIFRRRATVEASHELGHTFGLPHCEDPLCVMHFSNTIAETDRKGPAFCTACRSRVLTGNLLITGRPGSGKTTLIRHLAERFADCSPVGFYTIEVREGGVRVGFDLVSLTGERRPLARTSFPGPCRVGRYGVDISGFEEFLSSVPFFAPEARLVIIDEIGKMECCSGTFRRVVREVLDATTPCVATIAERGVPGLDRVRARADVRVVEVTVANRAHLLPDLEMEVRRLVGTGPG